MVQMPATQVAGPSQTPRQSSPTFGRGVQTAGGEKQTEPASQIPPVHASPGPKTGTATQVCVPASHFATTAGSPQPTVAQLSPSNAYATHVSEALSQVEPPVQVPDAEHG